MDSKKEKVKKLKKLARQKMPLKNLQSKKISSKKDKILDVFGYRPNRTK